MRLDLGELLHRIPASESTPPLYYLLAWLWAKAFGTGEVGLRSLSALLGTAFIPVAYATATELCSRRAGLAVAALAAFSPLLHWYSQEARSYALLALLTALSLWAFARALRRPRGRTFALWGLASALALATHYFAAFLVLPEAAWLATRPAVRRAALPALGVVVATAVALTPLALHQRSLGLASFIGDESLAGRVARAGKGFLVGLDAPLETALSVIAALIALGGAVAAFALARSRERDGAGVALAIGATAVAIPAVLAAVGVDYLDTRNLLGAWLPLMIVPAAGLAARRVGWAGPTGLALLCAFGLASIVGVALEPAWQRDDWRGIAAALGRPDGPRAVVVQPASGARPLRVYVPELGPLPGRSAAVEEIAVVSPVRRRLGGEHAAAPPRGPLPPVPGFELAARRLTESYSVMVLRAESPQPFSIEQAGALELVADEPSVVLLQPR